MPSLAFHAKRFMIKQDRCAMKVSTDGLLLGAWADAGVSKCVLDIGTGTGILALLIAQRFPNVKVDAIEFDDAAAAQASENFKASEWADRLHAHRADVRRVSSAIRYDHIVCNPPYYRGERPSTNATLDVAKHSSMLSLSELAEVISKLLAPSGQASLILPNNRSEEFYETANGNGLFLHRITEVRYKAESEVKRVLCSFGKKATILVQDSELVVRKGGVISDEYALMMEDVLDDPRS